jgi:hypothetical protein
MHYHHDVLLTAVKLQNVGDNPGTGKLRGLQGTVRVTGVSLPRHGPLLRCAYRDSPTGHPALDWGLLPRTKRPEAVPCT